MKTSRMRLGKAKELIDEGAIAVIAFGNEIYRIHEAKAQVHPAYFDCKLEFEGAYRKEELWSEVDVHIITGK